MIASTAPLAEITHSAIHLLCQEMGVVNTARFLSQFSLGYGNYTEERRTLFGQLTVKEIAEEIRREKLAQAEES